MDAHVHLHARFDPAAALDAAATSFANEAARWKSSPPALGVLLLAEIEGSSDLARLQRRLRGREGWRWSPTGEQHSVLAQRDGRVPIVLIRGFQVVTAERLEVLALMCSTSIASARPLDETLDGISRAGGIPTLPWGFGKWSLARRRVVETMLESVAPAEIFLGDNGGRPRIAPMPALLERGDRRGVRVLPGSDPLDLPWEMHRIGSFGFSIRAALDPARPAQSLCAMLRCGDPPLQPYGRAMGTMAFLSNQIALRVSSLARLDRRRPPEEETLADLAVGIDDPP